MEYPTVFPSLSYDDAQAAIDFLASAFGAERHSVHAGDDGSIQHAELRFGNGIVMLCPGRGEFPATRGKGSRSPAARSNSRSLSRPLLTSRTRAAGAEITRELNDTEYGSREYGAKDSEGNSWYFGTYQPFPGDQK